MPLIVNSINIPVIETKKYTNLLRIQYFGTFSMHLNPSLRVSPIGFSDSELSKTGLYGLNKLCTIKIQLVCHGLAGKSGITLSVLKTYSTSRPYTRKIEQRLHSFLDEQSGNYLMRIFSATNNFTNSLYFLCFIDAQVMLILF